MPEARYHMLEFTVIDEAAAFIAAMIDRFTTRRTAAQATPVDLARSAAKLIVGPASHAFGRDDILAHLIQPF